MIPKPSSCLGCPFYNYGKFYTPDDIKPGSEVLFIVEAPSADDEAGHFKYGPDAYRQQTPAPMIGGTGQLFNNRFLKEAGLKRSDVSVASAIRCRPGAALGLKTDKLPNLTNKMKLETSKADLVRALKHCKDAHLKVPTSVKTIVTMGSYALYQQTGINNVTDWRGYALDYADTATHHTVDTSYYHDLSRQKETYGPDGRRNDNQIPRTESRGIQSATAASQGDSQVFQAAQGRRLFVMLSLNSLFKGENKKYYHATLLDFAKLRRMMNGTWPSPLPTYSTVSPTEWPGYAAFDTEYTWDAKDKYNKFNNRLIRWSLCDTNYNLYCVEAKDTPHERIPIQPGSIVLIQNALADIGHLSGLVDFSSVIVEDMMLAHSVLWTGEPHGLNYIASVFGRLNRYKHLSADSPQLYSALDAYEPMYMWRNTFIPDFKQDPQSWHIYKNYRLPLVAIINKAQQTGVALDGDRLLEVQQILQERIASATGKSQVITKDVEFNLGGIKRVKEEIYG
jgi:uracil-DNA glycosylase